MSLIYAIGDIHGCAETFRKLLDEINLKRSDKLYLLGDYIDRGEDSKGVIDWILNLRKRRFQIHTLRGNHEQMLMDAYRDEEKIPHWFKNGGESTLRSFKVSSLKKIPVKYMEFFQRTKYFISCKDYVFVHAGLNFLLNNPFLDKKAMLWTRESYFEPAKINYRTLIHGHTPLALAEILEPEDPRKINIDGGCVHMHKPHLGNLIALELPLKKFTIVKNID